MSTVSFKADTYYTCLRFPLNNKVNDFLIHLSITFF
jgi:hypothetical protein